MFDWRPNPGPSVRSAWERRLCRSFMPALPERCPVLREGHWGRCGEPTYRLYNCRRCGVQVRICAAAITATFTARVSARGSAAASRSAAPARAISARRAGRTVMPPDNAVGGYVNGQEVTHQGSAGGSGCRSVSAASPIIAERTDRCAVACEPEHSAKVHPRSSAARSVARRCRSGLVRGGGTGADRRST